MLDVNNDKLSSESSPEDKSSNQENTPVNPVEQVAPSEDHKNEASVEPTVADEAEKTIDIDTESSSVAGEVKKAEEVEETVDEVENITEESSEAVQAVTTDEPTAEVKEEAEVAENTKEEAKEVSAPVSDSSKDVEVTKEDITELKAEGKTEEKAISEVVEEVSVADTDKDGSASAEKEEVKVEEKAESTEEEIKDGKTEEKSIPEFDVADLNLEGIVVLMGKLLSDFDIKDVRNQLETLKTAFQKKFKAVIAEKKEAFVKAGGEVTDFFYSEPVKQQFDEIHRAYKSKRQQYYKDLERIQKENLEVRLMLIDELKTLIDNAQASTMYKEFRNLQDRWREVGQIPHAKYNDVWRTYHHHVERFYDLLHLNNDFRDLDFKHNFEEKSKLIDKAEALAQHDDVNYAFKELQILHRMWKEDIGPVAREFREEVWHKFSEATKKIHKKRHEYQDVLDEKFKENVGLKLAVIEKIKALDYDNNKNHKDWQASIKKIEALRDEFFAIGRVPKSKNEEIWQLFRGATREFNSKKNSFYKSIKKDQAENLKKKILLVEQAESLKDSEEWEMATEVYKKVQAEWKKIGHVPRQDSDKIWKRFKDACNHFFDRLHNKQNVMDKDQSAVIDKKKEFMQSFKEQIEAGKDLSLEFAEKGLSEWRALGVLPHKVKHLDAKFHKLLDAAYKKLDISKDEASFLRFKSTVDSLLDQGNTRKLDSEQLFIRRKIDDITKEIKQLENNISFISNASEDNPLVRNVYKNIEEYKQSLEVWKRKINYMKRMEY